MKNWPLKWRLSFPVCFVLVTTIVIVSIVAYVELEEALLRNIDPTLKAMAEGILADLDEPESYEAHQAEFRSIAGYTGEQYSNRYRIWMDGSNDELFASDSSAETEGRLLINLPASDRPEVGEFTFFNLNHEKYKYRAVWTRRSFEQGVANILVASSSYYTYHEMEEFLQMLLILGGSLLLVTLLLVPLIVAWGMRPIDRVATVLRQITHKNVGKENLEIQEVPRELLPFVEALNGMLARLDKAIQLQKQFTADASHELRTPLAVIKSTIQTTRMTDRQEADYIKALDDALQDVNRMERLIEQLLCLARVDEGRDLPNSAPVALDALLAHLAEIFDARAMQQGGKVIFESSPTTRVKGNESELSQLFTNVLDNAVKYGPPNSTVCISLKHLPDGYVTVCVHDEGGKIPSVALARLFDRFYRVDSSRSRATGGAGLGLAIAQEIAHRHGGKIDVTSEPSKGTSVFVRLPRL